MLAERREMACHCYENTGKGTIINLTIVLGALGTLLQHVHILTETVTEQFYSVSEQGGTMR